MPLMAFNYNKNKQLKNFNGKRRKLQFTKRRNKIH